MGEEKPVGELSEEQKEILYLFDRIYAYKHANELVLRPGKEIYDKVNNLYAHLEPLYLVDPEILNNL